MNITAFLRCGVSSLPQKLTTFVIKPNCKNIFLSVRGFNGNAFEKNVIKWNKSATQYGAKAQAFNLNSFASISSSAAPNIPIKKTRFHKKRYASEIDPDNIEEGNFIVSAFATAKEYDLEKLRNALVSEDLYSPQKLVDQDAPDVLLAVAKYKVGNEPRHIFFFREGSVVFWNCSELESSNVLQFLKAYEEEPYSENVVSREREIMTYRYQEQGKNCQLQDSTFLLSSDPDNLLERFTFSNAMTQSVKLGVWENTLEKHADSLVNVTEILERGKPITLTRAEVLKKTGTFFALRHQINLESDLLDIPDFYWERAQLEKLYNDTISYFSLARRTRVLNEKLSHCSDLIELVASQLSDRHHVRLEWMIIILIMVEVGFESLHFVEHYWDIIFK